MNTQPQLAARAAAVVRPSRSARGTTAKLPVTSSSPSSTIMTKPTGKTRAPTRPTRVCSEAVNASVVANPSSAPDKNPRTSRSRTGSRLFCAPIWIIWSTTASGLTYAIADDLRVTVIEKEKAPGPRPQRLCCANVVGDAREGTCRHDARSRAETERDGDATFERCCPRGEHVRVPNLSAGRPGLL